MIKYQYKSEFARRYYEAGRAAGFEGGLAEGRAMGLEEIRAERRAEAQAEGRAAGLEEIRAERRTEGMKQTREQVCEVLRRVVIKLACSRLGTLGDEERERIAAMFDWEALDALLLELRRASSADAAGEVLMRELAGRALVDS